MKNIMEKMDEDQKKTIKKWAEKFDKESKELFEDFCEWYDDDTAKGIQDESERVNWALDVVRSRIADELSTPTEWIEMYCVGTDPAHDNDDRPGSVYGIGAIPNVSEPKFVIINAWQEEKKMIDEMTAGKSYEVKVNRQSAVKEQVEYQFVSTSKIKESDFIEDADNDKIENLIKNFFDRTKIKDAETNTSRPNDYTDFKMVKGMVQNHMIRGDTGMYFLQDDSVPLEDVEPNSALTIFTPPRMMEYGRYSELMVIGRITESNNDEYGVSMNAVGLIPLIETPLDEDASTVDEDTIEVADAQDDDVQSGVVQEDSVDDDDYSALM